MAIYGGLYLKKNLDWDVEMEMNSTLLFLILFLCYLASTDF